MSSQTEQPRVLTKLQPSVPATDGDGVSIQRNVAHGAPQTFDPFLLLDEIASDEAADYIGGFPEHPHRGFETVTYMLEGTMKHRDHLGNEGLLESGGVQWMTAGRGVLHSEMPQQESGRLHGFQLWVNLPAAQKMTAPRYREYSAEQIPAIGFGRGNLARVIAGTFTFAGQTVAGPVQGVSTQPDYIDMNLNAGEQVSLPVDRGKRVLIYVYRGQLAIGADARPLQQQQLGELSNGNRIEFTATADSGLLLLAGNPIGEPVVNWGPFVMNTREEIEQAISDYRNGRLVSETSQPATS
ncbi:pirin family protein [Exilibacterium tricleocarpae]|uniref:Pirin family protein n=1 Tax=Exilibacterium tricleocarpae TaxID=2591008 RepID=A0A545SPW5_9GAMM|nr:pirin family protein [Exilibacterium tricleocarpae]TQV66987.1 pirin family protein [Exilibacterium tricleocarpae]